MGLGIRTRAQLPRRGILRKRPGREHLFAEIRLTIKGAVTEPLAQRLLGFTTHENSLLVRLCPGGEWLRFTWSPDGLVNAECKTSTAGPGYHAFVLHLLDALTQSCGLRWQWDLQDGGGDETGYAGHRDFERLQREMAKLLQSLGRIFGEARIQRAEWLAVNMPTDYPAVCDFPLLVTPVGFLSSEWFEELVASEGSDLAHRCQRFFPWWHRERDARFWLNCGLVMSWMDLPWHPPAGEDEKETYRLALDCFARAKELDPDIAVPKSEISEIQELMGKAPDRATPPKPEGIGLRRHRMRHRLNGDWTIEFPGYYYQTSEEEGVIAYFGDRTLRACWLSARAKDGRCPEPEELLPCKDKPQFRGAAFIESGKGHPRGWACIKGAVERDHEFRMLNGYSAIRGTLLILTISYVNPADDDWAAETFHSVCCPEPEVSPQEEA